MLKLTKTAVQKLNFSKKLQLSVKLLQCSTVELNQKTQEILEQNPFLEVENQSVKTEENTVEFTDKNPSQSTDNSNMPQELYSTDESLYAHLKWQLDTGNFDARERKIADVILDAIDANGYFYADLEKIKPTIKLNPKAKTNEILKVLKKIQRFDPDGVAARNVQECLLLQLYAFANTHPNKKLAIDIVRNEYEALYTKNFSLIADNLRVDKRLLDNALKAIQSLKPYPGANFTDVKPIYSIPDLVVKKLKSRWQVFLYQNLYQSIKLKNTHNKFLQKVSVTSDKNFIKSSYQEAKWFKKCIDNRNNVLLKVAQIIINQQTDFLAKGSMYMHKLNLDTVAKLSGLHISTISRAVSKKYIQTPHGVHELKYFFRNNLIKQDSNDISSIDVKHVIKEIISKEDSLKPYSDEKIVNILSLKKINISRRTVAKYRLALNIPASSKRKLCRVK